MKMGMKLDYFLYLFGLGEMGLGLLNFLWLLHRI